MPRGSKSPAGVSVSPLSTGSADKPPRKSERSHEENQERAFIAASRRTDRGIEARVQSARMASVIHKKRTGRSFKISEEIVLKEDMYEEEDDDLPRLRYNLACGYSGTTGAAAGNDAGVDGGTTGASTRRGGAAAAASFSSRASDASMAATRRHEAEIDEMFARHFPGLAQRVQQQRMGGTALGPSPPSQPPASSQAGNNTAFIPPTSDEGPSPPPVTLVELSQSSSNSSVHGSSGNGSSSGSSSSGLVMPIPLTTASPSFAGMAATTISPPPGLSPNSRASHTSHTSPSVSTPVSQTDGGAYGQPHRTSGATTDASGSAGYTPPFLVDGAFKSLGSPSAASYVWGSSGAAGPTTATMAGPDVTMADDLLLPSSDDSMAYAMDTIGALDSMGLGYDGGDFDFARAVADDGSSGAASSLLTWATSLYSHEYTLSSTAAGDEPALLPDTTSAAVAPAHAHPHALMSGLTAEEMHEQLSSRIGTPGGSAGDNWTEWVHFDR